MKHLLRNNLQYPARFFDQPKAVRLTRAITALTADRIALGRPVVTISKNTLIRSEKTVPYLTGTRVPKLNGHMRYLKTAVNGKRFDDRIQQFASLYRQFMNSEPLVGQIGSLDTYFKHAFCESRDSDEANDEMQKFCRLVSDLFSGVLAMLGEAFFLLPYLTKFKIRTINTMR